MKFPKELTPAEKLCIDTWVLTQNASQSFETAFPGKYPDHRDATRRMRQLLEKPLANEYLKESKQEVEKKINISKDWLLDELIKLKSEAASNMDYSSSVKALFLIAKIMGYMSKQVIDVKKSVQITFGGGFQPTQNMQQLEAELLEPEQINYATQIQTIQFKEEQKLNIDDEDSPESNRDNTKIDEF